MEPTLGTKTKYFDDLFILSEGREVDNDNYIKITTLSNGFTFSILERHLLV